MLTDEIQADFTRVIGLLDEAIDRQGSLMELQEESPFPMGFRYTIETLGNSAVPKPRARLAAVLGDKYVVPSKMQSLGEEVTHAKRLARLKELRDQLHSEVALLAST